MRLALRLVAASGSKLTIPQLCDALSLRDNQTCIEEDDELDEEEVTKVCSSLLRKTHDQQHLEFAHFTVREFLESPSLLQDETLKVYHIPSDEDWFLVHFYLQFVLLDNFSTHLFSAKQILNTLFATDDAHPFYSFATTAWLAQFRSASAQSDAASTQEAVEPQLKTLVLNQIDTLFHRDKTPKFLLWAANYSVCCRPIQFRKTRPLRETIAGILHAYFTPLHMAAVLGLGHVIVPWIQHDVKTFLCSDWTMSPAECLLLGVPIFFCDADYTTDPDTPDAYKPKLMVSLWRKWMGRGTSPKVWALLVQLLATVAPIADLGVSIGVRRYTAVDLLCRRANSEDIVVFMKVFLELVRSGVKFDHRSIDCLLDTFVTSDWRSTSDFNELLSLITAFNELSSTADAPCQDDDTLSYMRSAIHKLTTACEIPVPAELSNREYDFALVAAVKYCNLSRLHELSLDPRFKTFHGRSVKGRTLLHVAARTNALAAAEFLLTHEADHSIQDKCGRTALHFARDKVALALLNHGASDAVRDNDGNTVWHRAARAEYSILQSLLDTCRNIETRLRELDEHGSTPLAAAIYADRRENALLLLPYCQSVECFAGRLPLYQEALRFGFDDVIAGLIAAKIPVEDDSTLLRHVNPRSSANSIRLLKALRADACDQRHDGWAPIERLLEHLFEDGAHVNVETIMEIMPTSALLRTECLQYFCDEIIPRAVKYPNDDFSPWVTTAFEAFLDQGVFAAYETTKKKPAYKALSSALLGLVTDRKLDWESMVTLDSCFLGILKSSSIEANAESLLPLLCIGVYANWESVIHQILSTGIDVHGLSDGRSCLEFACKPYSQCSPSTFARLLAEANSSKLNDPSRLSKSCLLHRLANKKVPWREDKLKLLLDKGADPNVRRADSRPAVLAHAQKNSVNTVEILLNHGADPEATSDDGWNVMLTFVSTDEPDGLRMLRKIRPGIDWGKTIHLQPSFGSDKSVCRLVKESDIPDCNALHIAVATGSLSSLKYLLKEGLISDLNAPAGIGYTCAHFAIGSNRLATQEMLKYLHSNSCDLNALSDLGETPYDIAVRWKRPKFLTRFLLELGGKAGSGACSRTNQEGDSQLLNSLVPYIERRNRPSSRMPNDKTVQKLQLQRLKEAIDAGNVPACSRLRSQGCPMDQPLPGGPGIPIIAALSSKKPDVVLWLLENGGGKWGTLSDDAEEGVIQHALRYKSCNTLLESLMHHFELIWPEWITGGWSAINAAIRSGNMDGLRIVLNFIRNLSGRKRYVGSSQTGLRQADSSPWQQWKHDGGPHSA
jgi:ankyrin repeat protein